MKRLKYVASATVVAAAFLAAIAARVEAQDTQDRGRFAVQAPLLPLVGLGSSIGVTVRDSDSGVVVEQVHGDSPASRAGLMQGDVVTEFDGERARSAAQFTRLVRETASGRTVKIAVRRDGAVRSMDITPDNREPDDLRFPNLTRDFERSWRVLPRDFAFDFDFAEPFAAVVSPRRLGTAVTPLSDQLAAFFGVKEGVLVSEVTPGSPAEAAGIRAGDVIVAIAGKSVASPEDAAREMRQAQPGTNVEVRVMRDRKEVTLTAKMPDRSERPRSWGRGVRPV